MKSNVYKLLSLLCQGVGLTFILLGQGIECFAVESGIGRTYNSRVQVGSEVAEARLKDRPNILLIVVDDLGFNDIGFFGSEIHTPNIDMLAGQGAVLTNFHTAPSCSPTRSMLLSGTDNHIAGLGTMAEGRSESYKATPGYEGYLNFHVAALPELLQDAGYHTYMTGKWHLGSTEKTSPAARGFDKSFVLIDGGAGHFSNRLPVVGPEKALYREDYEVVEQLPADFYSTQYYAERMIEYIEGGRNDEKPFFSYLAFSAPHWPLQAPEASIIKYNEIYDKGYDELVRLRLERAKELGLVSQSVERFPSLKGVSAWDDLSHKEKQFESRKMEIYAAMIDDLDIYIGKVINYLKSIGEYENTFIIFMSDNGPEGRHIDRWPALQEWVKSGCCDNRLENIGRENSYIWLGPGWGQASNVPSRLFKTDIFQGGVRAPAFAHFPKMVVRNNRADSVVSVMDVMPTILDVAGVKHPMEGRYRGRDVVTMKGTSMLSYLRGGESEVHDEDYFIGWEYYYKRGLRQGDWKITWVPENEASNLFMYSSGVIPGQWQLYNLIDDPREMNDLSGIYPGTREKLVNLWSVYKREVGVVLLEE